MDGNMLKPGKIPKIEPLIRVGLILPQDEIESIQVSFSDPQCFELETEKKLYPSCNNQDELTIQFRKGQLHISQLDVTSPTISIIPSIPDKNPYITLFGMIAGRGFHWQKQINASFWGKIEFSVIDGKIIAINELPLEQYLKCVATSEMSAQCPSELLKAQTIVARSWLLANMEQKHRHLGFDICNDDCCQRYQGMANTTDTSINSANDTFGQVLIFNDQICDARYSKSCGGITEKYENVWEGDPVPYLCSIPDVNESGTAYCSPQIVSEDSLKSYIGNVDEKGKYFHWTYELSQSELMSSLKKKCELIAVDILELRPLKTGDSGRIIDLEIEYLDEFDKPQSIVIKSEYQIRDVLSPSFLYSSAFTIEKENDDSFQLSGRGWGHGVGMCQIGALGMAFSNHDHAFILRHYYLGSELKTIYQS